MISKLVKLSVVAIGLVGAAGTANLAYTAPAGASSTSKTKLPLPRFVSIKAKRVNMRVGPGKQYKVDWRYQKRGLPMEIIQEYDNWRKVRDAEGNEGWILHSLLSGKRTAIVSPWNRENPEKLTDLRKATSHNSRLVARLEPGVIADVEACDDQWCEINIEKVSGYISKDALWGVYPDEKIEN